VNLGARMAIAWMGVFAPATLPKHLLGTLDRGLGVLLGTGIDISALGVVSNVVLEFAADRISIEELVDTPFKVQEQPVFEAWVRDGPQHPQLPSRLDGIASLLDSLVVLWTFGVEDDPDFIEWIFEASSRLVVAFIPGLPRCLHDARGC
jgi:hypothetical protein